MVRTAYTRDQLDNVLQKTKTEMEAFESEFPTVRPLPAMTAEECEDMFDRLMDQAEQRPLTREECFLHGQIVTCFLHAVRAETLGKPGRYFCVSEDDVVSIVEASGDGHTINQRTTP